MPAARSLVSLRAPSGSPPGCSTIRREATTTTIHQGFQWLLDPDGDPDTNDYPDVVNNSWSIERVDQCDTEFEPDVQALKAMGIAVVFCRRQLRA